MRERLEKATGFALAVSPSHLLHRAQQLAADEFTSRLDRGGVTVRQFAVLAAIADQPGQSQTDLVRATGIDRSTLADLIARLQDRGLIARDRAERDGRAKSVTLTASGRNALAACAPHAKAADEALLALLPKGKRQAFLDALQRLSGLEEARAKKMGKAEKKAKPKKASKVTKPEKPKAGKKAKKSKAATSAPVVAAKPVATAKRPAKAAKSAKPARRATAARRP